MKKTFLLGPLLMCAMAVLPGLNLSAATSTSTVAPSAASITQPGYVPDYMQSFVIKTDQPTSSEATAIANVITLNDEMFGIYDHSIEIFKENFLSNHPLVMALFSGKGGRFLLYRPGRPVLEADSVRVVYQIAKSVGHTAMATFELLAPYTADPTNNQGWLGKLRAYRTDVQVANDSLNAIDLNPDVRKLLRDTLDQIAAFMDQSIKNRTFTYQQMQTFARKIKPNLAKLIDVATNAQVNHWLDVMQQWKQMLGPEQWERTYGLSNSIYVARQNNILFSILAQFFGEEAINDRLIFLETTDFTTTPDAMLNAFMRIVSDRMIGGIFFNEPRLMDHELLGGSARKVLEQQAGKRGFKAVLPPLVPFNSHEWPWAIDPKSGKGAALMEDIPENGR